MDCSNCTKVLENKIEPVPYIAHESAMARNERTIKRLVTTVLVILLLWFSTIGIFIWYINQYDFSAISYEQDGEGINIIGDRNGVGFDVTEDDGQD